MTKNLSNSTFLDRRKWDVQRFLSQKDRQFGNWLYRNSGSQMTIALPEERGQEGVQAIPLDRDRELLLKPKPVYFPNRKERREIRRERDETNATHREEVRVAADAVMADHDAMFSHKLELLTGKTPKYEGYFTSHTSIGRDGVKHLAFDLFPIYRVNDRIFTFPMGQGGVFATHGPATDPDELARKARPLVVVFERITGELLFTDPDQTATNPEDAVAARVKDHPTATPTTSVVLSRIAMRRESTTFLVSENGTPNVLSFLQRAMD